MPSGGQDLARLFMEYIYFLVFICIVFLPRADEFSRPRSQPSSSLSRPRS
jgi:hypothetical protein